MKGIDVWKLNFAMAWGSALQTRQRLRSRDVVIRAHRITPRPFNPAP